MQPNALKTAVSKLNREPNKEALVNSLRQLAVQYVREMACPDDITPEMFARGIHLAGNPSSICLHQFKSPDEKAAYLQQQTKPGIWGEDAILLPFMQALDYNVHIYLTGHDEFTQQAVTVEGSDKSIILLNRNNTYWDLLIKADGHLQQITSKHDGNCMYDAIANQLIRDKVVTLQPADKTHAAPNDKAIEPLDEKARHTILWTDYTFADQTIRKHIKDDLMDKLIEAKPETLKSIFTQAKNLSNNDAYMANKKWNDYSLEGNRVQLIHIITIEAWRNTSFRDYLIDHKYLNSMPNIPGFNAEELQESAEALFSNTPRKSIKSKL